MAARGLGKGYQGSKWIRPEKRLAIYLRDGLACAYCGETLEQSALSLDHLVSYSQGGSNDASNLITCCKRCNSSRGDRDYREFARSCAEYLNHGVTVESIVERILQHIARPIDVVTAKAIISRR